MSLALLDVVNICDNVHLRRDATGLYDVSYGSEALVPFYLSENADSGVIGLLRPIIVEQLKLENARRAQEGLLEMWCLRLEPSHFVPLKNGAVGPSVSFRAWLDTPTKRSAAMKEMCERWRDTGLFANVCGPAKWRSEMYPIYADPYGIHDHPLTAGREDGLNYAFEVERSVCPLFGLVAYGVHMNIYEEKVLGDGNVEPACGFQLESLTGLRDFPGFLDNTAAGGIPSGISIFEAVIKECIEEANIDSHILRNHARAVSSISYFYRNTDGWLQPEVGYIYDVVIPPGVDHVPFTPRPLDGEAESFEFMPHEKILEQLRAGRFKPNCGLVILDLFIRLGYITPDNEPNLLKVVKRLHGSADYEKW
ncbi:hypothetical protein NLJ89_g6341 [Agrocybe chaxingu]|uniref:Nudix hydrolase domain-containing protein n=1 Tax=Agrocybe chaxingu TaxID=84603 RepID=A0A9W8MSS7_9AGAR|nr:hypothetical protein NLJ89_g6341 [Agrocybe chaxingu]